MPYLIAAAIAWAAFVIFGAFVMTARIRGRASRTDFGGLRQLLGLVPVIALVAWILYSMTLSLLEGHIKLPTRGPDHYFSLAQAPTAFWTIFLLEFLLTALTSMVVFAVVGLVLRRCRHEA